jgi:tetratricopeptide (TPR) repeat protein
MHTQASNIVITGAGAGAGMVNLGPAAGGGRVLVDGRMPVRIDVAPDGADWRNPKKDGKPLDPREIWENALAKSVNEPGLIIACTDFLVQNRKFDHAAEFLKSNLRQGVIVRPWVYKSLAIALRESGGSTEEIERAEVSAADLEPLNGQGYLLAARALAEDKNYERALAFCKQAAVLEPGVPHAFADAARYADMAGDAKAMEWATGHLLRQDWPVGNDDLQRTAVEKLELLSRRLDGAAAKRLVEAVHGQRRRDLVIKLLWQGEADLDLKVEEPTGSVCSALNKQTVGGGTLIGDSLASMTSETYAAAEAFSGNYKVWVERIWGKALGGKAQLKIIRHQGTPEETEELVTVKISGTISEPVTVKLGNGRRTETAYVSPPSAQQPGEDATPPQEGSDAVLNKLRALSDPEVTGFERGAPQGGVSSSGRPVNRRTLATPRTVDNDRLLYQNRVQSFVANSVDVTAQAVLSADRRSVTVSLKPVFNVAASDKPVQVNSPVFPGAPSNNP